MIYNKLFNKVEEELNSTDELNKKELELKTLFLSFVFILPLSFIFFDNLISINLKLIFTLVSLTLSVTLYYLLLYLNKLVVLISYLYSFFQSLFIVSIGMYLKDLLFKYIYNSIVFITVSVTIIFVIFITNIFYLIDLIKIKIFYYKYLVYLTFNLLIILITVFTVSKINNLYLFTYNFLASLLTMLFFTLFSIEYHERIRKDIQLNIKKSMINYLIVLPFTLSSTFLFDIIYSITFKKR